MNLHDMRWPIMVAELGASHNGSLARAQDLVSAAADAGADAVKFQTYTPETLAVDGPIISGPWAGRTYHDLYREAMTPWEWLPDLFEHAQNLGLVAFSSPFSGNAVRYLERLGCPMYKIASPEITHEGLICRVAETGKPVIISTGMATDAEIVRAAVKAQVYSPGQVVLLHCISAYPATPEQYNLPAMEFLKSVTGELVGLSDHTLGSAVAVAAVARGAMMVEKHFTLRRSDGGPDAAFSAEPEEFAAMVRDCRIAAAAIRSRTPFEIESSRQYRRSLWVTKAMRAGDCFTPVNLEVLRPAGGLSPYTLSAVLGLRAACDIPAGTALAREHFNVR